MLLAAPSPAPTISQFSVQPGRLQAGQPATLSWSLSGGPPSTLTLEDNLSGSAPINVAGKSSLVLPQVLRRQTFTLRAGNGQGAATASLTLVARGLSLLAGAQGGPGSLDGSQDGASFLLPAGLAVDAEQTVYVADTGNHAIRQISKGTVTTFAGGGRAGDQDGDALEATFRLPMAVLLAQDGSLLVCDSGNGRIRTIQGGVVGSYGTGTGTGSGTGTGTGSGTEPPAAPAHPFRNPVGLAMDAAGNLFIADTGNSAIRRVARNGEVTAFAGSPWSAARPGGDHDFSGAAKVVVNPATGIALVAYHGNGRLHRISPEGRVEALGERSFQDKRGTEPALPAGVAGLAVDSGNSLYVATAEGKILRRSPEGLVTLLAGPPADPDGEEALAGSFPRPADLAVDSVGNVFVTDAFQASVTRISRSGAVTCFAGVPGRPGYRDGGAGDAQFRVPAGIAVDSADNLIVADRGAHTIRRISPMGYVTTLAGRAGSSGCEDGDGANARFNDPQGVAVDARGNFYVADTGNATIRKISPEGQVTTVAGIAGQAGGALGPLPGRLTEPRSVAVTPAGDLLVLCGNGIVQVTDP